MDKSPICYSNSASNIDDINSAQKRWTVLHCAFASVSKKYIGPMPKIKNVKFHNPATIVFWEDGTKTVVKSGNDDIFDPEKGLAMAIAKRALGNQGNYYNEIRKWTKESLENCSVEKK